MELVDFYHVVEHLGTLAGLKKNWSKKQKQGWITRQSNRLKRGKVEQFQEEVKKFCRGKRGKDWRRERDYLLRNASAGRLNYGSRPRKNCGWRGKRARPGCRTIRLSGSGKHERLGRSRRPSSAGTGARQVAGPERIRPCPLWNGR